MSTILLVTFLLPFFVRNIAGRDVPPDMTGFPLCAQKCISDNHGNCALLDMPCMCNSRVPSIFSCMQGSCSAEDQATTITFAQELCAQVNATSTATVSGASSTSAVATSTNLPGDDSLPSPDPTPSESSSSGLSTGATAGIGVGAALGGLAAIAGAFFYWRRRRRSRTTAGHDGISVGETDQGGYVITAYDPKGIPHEIGAAQCAELEAKDKTRMVVYDQKIHGTNPGPQ